MDSKHNKHVLRNTKRVVQMTSLLWEEAPGESDAKPPKFSRPTPVCIEFEVPLRRPARSSRRRDLRARFPEFARSCAGEIHN